MRPLRGGRVRHAGEQYPEAHRAGTARVLVRLSNGDYLVRRDAPLLPELPRDTIWPGWATLPAEG